MSEGSFIIHAYSFDGKGGGVRLSEDTISSAIKDKKLAWIHMNVEHPETEAWLQKEVSYLDPLIPEALLVDEARPRYTPIGDGALIVLRGVNLNIDAEPEDMVSIRLWIDKSRIISTRRRKLKAVQDIKEALEVGRGPKDAGDFLTLLTTRLFERMFPILNSLGDTVDDIEEKILLGADIKLRQDIVSIRKQAILLRRYLAPQRDVVGQLRQSEVPYLKPNHRRYMQEGYDRVMRYVEDLDALRERCQIIQDELGNILTDRLNKNMYILSVIAAIFLPLGFLTGLLGVNLGGIPGADNQDAFFMFSGMLGTIVLIQVLLFRLFKWF